MTAQELVDRLLELIGEYGDWEVVLTVGLDGNCEYKVGKVAINPKQRKIRLLPGGFLQ